MNKLIVILKNAVKAFIHDGALGRGAAIAFYTVTSIAPLLLIVIALAGLFFGREAAQNGIVDQLDGMMGRQSAELLQTTIASAQGKSSGVLATLFGIVMIVVTASGVFGEMQAALNAIWKADPAGTPVSRLIRARAASLGLVASLGFLLMASLIVSTALAAFGNYINSVLPFSAIILGAVNAAVSLFLLTLLFAAIYKMLPDCNIDWKDVAIGAVTTAVLFMIGKSFIGWYIGRSGVASGYGAAGALIIILLWVYYSAQIFLFGAEFTKAYADQRKLNVNGAPATRDRASSSR